MKKNKPENQSDSFGEVLKKWRNLRNLSQLDLALISQVSQRHISFLESGRAQPSQKMILKLATVLEVPLRQQNLMLSLAGFAPIHTETDLSSPEMELICKALNFVLSQQEPYPAIVVDRYWNLLMSNQGATTLLETFISAEKLQRIFCINNKVNLMRVMFDEQGLRPYILNWDTCAGHLLRRVNREANSSIVNEKYNSLFEELMSYPDIASLWDSLTLSMQNELVLSVQLRKDNLDLSFFSTIATLGTPYDITLQEIRIECLFPADEITENNWQALLESS